MSFSIQTNVNSMVAQENMRINSNFQSRTIQRLTSGYRINNSGDDAAGLAVANSLRSSTAEMTQGVRNANDGISQLQIVDGGLGNITTMLHRLTTLATQSASATFTGDRGTLNTEYQQLVSEITRQADNIGLNAGGTNNLNLSVYIGGGSKSTVAGSSTVNVDLSSSVNAVDATSLNLDNTNVAGGGVDLGSVTTQDNTTATQDFKLYYADGTPSSTITVPTNKTVADAVKYLNTNDATVASHGISFSVDGNGKLRVAGSQAFSLEVAAGGAGTLSTKAGVNDYVNSGLFTQTQTADFAAVGVADETLDFSGQSGAAQVKLLVGTDLGSAITQINSDKNIKALGITAVKDGTGNRITFQSSTFFNLTLTEGASQTGGVAAMNAFAAADTSATTTGSAATALTSITAALKRLGLVQGQVGAGENKLQYAINLAQSQIANFSTAESQIRDADIAAEAANLTKAQVLQQSSIAAMAQANSAPQAILKLLQ